METKIRSGSAAALILAACLSAAGAAAQEPPAAEPGRAEQEERRSALERARAELETAAREVARLSALTRVELRRLTPRSTLGIVVDDADGHARVLNVTPNGPAAEAGLASGDVIVAIDGTQLAADDAAAALAERVTNLDPGTPVRLEVLRDGAEHAFVVTARDADRPFLLAPRLVTATGRGDGPDISVMPVRDGRFVYPHVTALRALNTWQSLQLVALTPDLGRYFGTEQGMLVVRAPERDGLGLRDGDVIVRIGEREPSSPEHASRILASFEPGEALRITIMRDGDMEVLDLEAPAQP